ncbi:MAG: hypothetical protein ACFFDN_16535 [Candidatus Hodarchaeota archaeon]
MSNVELKNELDIRILTDKHEILKYLQIGISIPVLSEHHRYISETFRIFNPIGILLEKKIKKKNRIINHAVGLCVVFKENDILFFGFFGIYNDEEEEIEILLDYLIEYATENNYRLIRGPINIPAIIFGYGFSVEHELYKEFKIETKFIAYPRSPLIYHQIFLKKGFYNKFSEDYYYMPLFKLDPLKLKYDYTNYEVLFPGREKIWDFADDIIKLHEKNMPKESLITPKSSQYIKVVISFIFDCGKPWMFWLLKHKPTNKIAGTVHIVPNVFGEKDSKGRYKTASLQHGVIDKKYQRKGLMLYLYGMGSLKAKDRKSGNNIKYGIGTVASENKSSIAWVTNLGGKIYGRNVILEYKL